MNSTVGQLAAVIEANYERRGSIDQSSWEDKGRQIVATVSNAAWDVGDWVNEAKGEWGDTYKMASEITGMAVKTLQQYAYVAERFPNRLGVSFHHHMLVAWIPQDAATQWLELAAAEQWSVREMQAALKARKQMPPGTPEIVATVFKIAVPHDHEVQWRAVSEAQGLTINEWLMSLADAAVSDWLSVADEAAA